jgi:hypothetical protein
MKKSKHSLEFLQLMYFLHNESDKMGNRKDKFVCECEFCKQRERIVNGEK